MDKYQGRLLSSRYILSLLLDIRQSEVGNKSEISDCKAFVTTKATKYKVKLIVKSSNEFSATYL